MDTKNLRYMFMSVYIYMNTTYSVIKKKEILLSVTMWMELDGIMLSERERQMMNGLTYISCIGRQILYH